MANTEEDEADPYADVDLEQDAAAPVEEDNSHHATSSLTRRAAILDGVCDDGASTVSVLQFFYH